MNKVIKQGHTGWGGMELMQKHVFIEFFYGNFLFGMKSLEFKIILQSKNTSQ